MATGALVIAGPSAVGKTTVGNILLSEDSRFCLSRSVTTRAPRGDGFDAEYIYLSREEFVSLRERGGLFEWTEYSGDLYGTAVSEIERINAEGKIPLLIIDLAGVRSVGEGRGNIDSCILYIYDDLNVMESRLYQRYLSSSPDAKKLKSFVDRKEKNIKDYLDLPDICKYLFAFIHNSGEPSATAELLLKAFSEHESGMPRKGEQIADTARSLAASAAEKLEVKPQE